MSTLVIGSTGKTGRRLLRRLTDIGEAAAELAAAAGRPVTYVP